MSSERPAELTPEARTAIRQYLKSLATRWGVAIGIANLLGLVSVYAYVARETAEVAAQKARVLTEERVEALDDQLGLLQGNLLSNVSSALSEVGAAKAEIQRVRDEVTTLSEALSQVENVSPERLASIFRLVRRYQEDADLAATMQMILERLTEAELGLTRLRQRPALGLPSTLELNRVVRAESDGFVLGTLSGNPPAGAAWHVEGQAGLRNPPSQVRAAVSMYGHDGPRSAKGQALTLVMPVGKGEYFQVKQSGLSISRTRDGAAELSLRWMPLWAPLGE